MRPVRQKSNVLGSGGLLKKFPPGPFKTFGSDEAPPFAANAPRETKIKRFGEQRASEKVSSGPLQNFGSGEAPPFAAHAPRETKIKRFGEQRASEKVTPGPLQNFLFRRGAALRRPRAVEYPWNQSFRPPFPKRRRGQGAEPLDAPAGAEHPILRSAFLVLFSRKKERRLMQRAFASAVLFRGSPSRRGTRAGAAPAGSRCVRPEAPRRAGYKGASARRFRGSPSPPRPRP